MRQRPRIHYTENQKALMWERWRQGESLQKIAQLFGRNHSSIQQILAATGGIRPTQRCRSKLALTLAEREEISRAVVAGQSTRSIAMVSGGHRLPSAERSNAMVVRNLIGQARPTKTPGIGHDGQSPVSWRRTGRLRTP
jgi:hypothetical protein